NGVDPQEYLPDHDIDTLERHGIDPATPSVVFVGRITRQKGMTHLLDAADEIDPSAQLVLCASAPDTPGLAAEVAEKVARLQDWRPGVVWIPEPLPRSEVVQIMSHATVFCCPSIYEPLGIVNLEAMACEAAVVATATGGIPEVVDDGVTGLLVPYEPVDHGTSACTSRRRCYRRGNSRTEASSSSSSSCSGSHGPRSSSGSRLVSPARRAISPRTRVSCSIRASATALRRSLLSARMLRAACSARVMRAFASRSGVRSGPESRPSSRPPWSRLSSRSSDIPQRFTMRFARS